MASPFPGMDPFLEQAEIFSGLHDRLITYLSESLQPLLPPPYYADMGRRAWIEVSERYIGPDVNVVRPRRRESSRGHGGRRRRHGLAGRRRSHSSFTYRTMSDESLSWRFPLGRGKNRRLVTTIEVLSPSNKCRVNTVATCT